MEHLIEVVYVKDIKDIRKFNFVVNTGNYILVKERLKHDYIRLVNHLKKLKEKGLITTIFQPKNKKMQDHLDLIVNSKRTIKKAIKKINSLFN
jgi:hypothetical protein